MKIKTKKLRIFSLIFKPVSRIQFHTAVYKQYTHYGHDERVSNKQIDCGLFFFSTMIFSSNQSSYVGSNNGYVKQFIQIRRFPFD